MEDQQKPSFFKRLTRGSLLASGGIGLFVIEAAKIVILASITVVVVRYVFFKPFYVQGASMEPTFYGHEYLIIDEISYRFHPPERGDVIVFRYPEDPKEYFLKRIIGLPGERVKIADGKVTIYNNEHPEGVIMDEAYLPNDLMTMGEKNTTLSDNQYFVLGDNRPNSYDSRRFGPIDKSAIVGRVAFRGWPLNRVQTFKTPEFTNLNN